MVGIGDWPARRASGAASRPAIVYGADEITYEQLATRVDRLAAALRDHNIAPGDRIAYLGANHPSFIEALLACAVIGAVFVPLNMRLSAVELHHMLDDCVPRILIVSEEHRSLGDAARSDLRTPPDVVQIGGSTDGSADYEMLIAQREHVAVERVQVASDWPLLIIYTSGTTGRAKGAVLSHGAVVWNSLNVIADYDLSGEDRALMISPLFHVASLGMGCLPVLLKGGTVILESRFVPSAALHEIQTRRVSYISGVPTTFQLMVEDRAWTESDISSLRLLTCGGSPVPDWVREAYESRGLAFSAGYGMTEAGPGVTLLAPSLSKDHPGSAGLPHSFVEIRIRRADGSLAAPGENGEIEVRGPNLFSGYWNQAEATSAAFDGDWFRTGDVGYRDRGGFLYLVDRLKDMIISGGENVYSVEVEQAISQIDGVTGVAVIGVPHDRWGEVPHAVIELASGAALDPGDMVAALSSRLARYKVPRSMEIVDQLPRTASGKVRKQLLRERYDRGASSDPS